MYKVILLLLLYILICYFVHSDHYDLTGGAATSLPLSYLTNALLCSFLYIGHIGRVQASCAGDQEFGSRSSQTDDL